MNRTAFAALLNTDKLVWIDFYADWCGPCKMMEPGLANITKDLHDKVTIVRINVDENPDLAMGMNITSIPSFKLYKNKALIWQHVGFIEEDDLRKKLN
jgi:thioredoxin